VVIRAGGGGIATMCPSGTRTLVGVDAVYLDRGTPSQRAVVSAHPDALDPGLFPAGSMGPKVEAAEQFARASGRPAVIGSLEQLSSMLAGHGGTRISVHAEGMETR
jgi:carbamate kinase